LKKLDLRKDLKKLYSASTRAVELLEVPTMSYIMVDGSGDPNTSAAYRDSIDVLYTLSYTLKFAIKKEEAIDYPVMALESLWWLQGDKSVDLSDKNSWNWTSMIMQPECVTQSWFQRAVATAKEKKDLPSLSRARLETFHEGLSAQILHVGPYSAEAPTIAKIHAFMTEKGYVPSGRHHEIYLSDPRRSAPEKLRTVLRQPVRPKSADV
jgi:hypothetical protein